MKRLHTVVLETGSQRFAHTPHALSILSISLASGKTAASHFQQYKACIFDVPPMKGKTMCMSIQHDRKDHDTLSACLENWAKSSDTTLL